MFLRTEEFTGQATIYLKKAENQIFIKNTMLSSFLFLFFGIWGPDMFQSQEISFLSGLHLLEALIQIICVLALSSLH